MEGTDVAPAEPGAGPVPVPAPAPAPSHVPRKRLKVRACAHCAESHAACNEERPCERCKKRGIACLDKPSKRPHKLARIGGAKLPPGIGYDPFMAHMAATYAPPPEYYRLRAATGFELTGAPMLGYAAPVSPKPMVPFPAAPTAGPPYSARAFPSEPGAAVDVAWNVPMPSVSMPAGDDDDGPQLRFVPFKGVPRQPLIISIVYNGQQTTLELAPSSEVSDLRQQIGSLFAAPSEELLLTYMRGGDRVIVHDTTDVDQLLASAGNHIELFVKKGQLLSLLSQGQSSQVSPH